MIGNPPHLAGRKANRVCAASDYQRRHGRDHSHGFVRENKSAHEDVDQRAGNAWSPEGAEIWFTASDTGSSRWLHAVDAGRARASDCGGAGRIDSLRHGERRARVVDGIERARGVGIGFNSRGWRTRVELVGLVAFLRSIARREDRAAQRSGRRGRPEIFGVLAEADGSPAVRLGDGTAIALSPDGEWVAAFDTHRDPPIPTLLLPTGAGQTRKLTADKLDCRNVAWLPDSKGLLITAKEAGKGARVYLQPIDGGEPRALTPEGYAAPKNMVAPDGKTFLARRPADGEKVSVADQWWESGKEILGLEPADVTVRWSADGKSILTYQGADRKTLWITRVDVTTGKRQVVKNGRRLTARA